MTDNTRKTQMKLVPKNDLLGWITLADIPDRGTTLIMQRYRPPGYGYRHRDIFNRHHRRILFNGALICTCPY
ncbi:hypothetical protein AB6J89_004700 [Salmonella enterica]